MLFINLSDLCMKNISLNLYLNYEICSKYSWKIPNELGNLIYKYYFYSTTYREEDLNFFNGRITSITKFDKKYNKYCFIKILKIISIENLKEIYLSNSHLNEEISKNFGRILENCHKIEIIDISQNEFMGNGLLDICNGLTNSSNNLRRIDFSRCALNSIQSKYISKLLMYCSKIEKINLCWNRDLENGLLDICNGLINSSSSLREVNLSRCALDEKQCEDFAKLLHSAINVEIINLCWNRNMGNGLLCICQGLVNSSNSLRELDLSRCDLNGNQSKDVSKLLMKCHKLEIISIHFNNNLRDGLLDVCNGLKNSIKTLKKINFFWFDLNQYQILDVGRIIMNCSKIETIEIFWNKNVENELLEICKRLISSSNNLQKIDLSCCYLHENQTRDIAKLLRNYSKIEIINLNGNKNMGDGILNISNQLELSSHSLKEIHFSDCYLNESQSRGIGKLLSNCFALEKISLIWNKNMGKGLSCICEGLISSSNTLKEINLSCCSLDEIQTDHIAKLLINCGKIEAIRLDCNYNMGVGFSSICHGLKNSSSTLEEITLSYCDLSENQCGDIGNVLRYCRNIKKLDLCSNKNMGKGLSIVCNGLENSLSTLCNISFSMCNLNLEQCKCIGQLLTKCYKIEKINLQENENMNNGLLNICNGLSNSSNILKEINLSFCKLNENQSKNVGKLLTVCSTIEIIDLRQNEEMGNGLLDICNGLLNSSNTLKRIDLSCNLNENQRKSFKKLLRTCSKLKL